MVFHSPTEMSKLEEQQETIKNINLNKEKRVDNLKFSN